MKLTSKLVQFRLVTSLIVVFMLAACGGGSGPAPVPGTPQILTGALVDGPVGGMPYITTSQSGFTSAAGEFLYQQGESITFTFGGIVLGPVAAAPVITPVELTGSVDPTAPAAVNLMIFLQTIDLDSNPLNGITITNSMLTAAQGLSLDFTSPTFAADVITVVAAIAPGKTVISAQAALDNFYETYKQLGGSSTFSWPFPGYPPFPGPPVDLLLNGSFENPATAADTTCSPNGATVPNWDCFNANFVVTSNAPAAVSGTRVLKQFGADAGARQSVAGLPGNTYTASAQVQNFSGDPLTALVLLQMSFLDSSGQAISNLETFGNPDNATDPNHTLLPSNTWVPLSVSGTAPAGTARVQVLLIHLNVDAATGNPVGAGSAFWDDVKITGPAPVAPPPVPVVDLVTNGDFELPDASIADQPCTGGTWMCFNSNFTVSNSGPGMTPAAHSGTQVLKQYGADGGAFFDAPAVPGEIYIASAWAQNFSGDPLNNLVIVQLFFLDINGISVNGPGIPFAQESAIPLSISPVDTYLPPNTWVQLTAQGVAPANAVSVRIQLLHTNNSVTGLSGGAIFWDDATLIGPGSGLSLVWADEFNGATLDLNNWSYETGYGSNGWGNDEWQLYTSDINNVSIVPDPGNMNNSFLSISALCPTAPACGKRDDTITSARINTLAKFEFRFGRAEARIQVPGGLSSWPAFWMLGAKFPVTGWPKAGEIDILEVFDNKNEASSAMHWCDESLNAGCSFPNGYRFVANAFNTGSSLANAFHVFEMEWDVSGVRTKVDGTEFFSTTIQPATMEEFLDDFFLILNVAIGGNPVTNPGPTTTWPQTMLVDYVRVYQ